MPSVMLKISWPYQNTVAGVETLRPNFKYAHILYLACLSSNHDFHLLTCTSSMRPFASSPRRVRFRARGRIIAVSTGDQRYHDLSPAPATTVYLAAAALPVVQPQC
jgi:hypothetical protein